jgi:hypothetical protein
VHSRGVVVAPALPVIVQLGAEPYYYHSGYHYYYSNNSWSYSNSRSGPWTTLPRSHYPKETRYKVHTDNRDSGRNRGNDSRNDRDGDRSHDRDRR